MNSKRTLCFLSLVLSFLMLVGCTQQPASTPSNITTVASDGGAVVDTTQSIATTINSLLTTMDGSVSSTTLQNTSSTSPDNSSTFTATVSTQAAPTIHTLTPIEASAYYGLSKLREMPNGNALAGLYQTLVAAVGACQTTVTLNETLSEHEVAMVFFYYRADYPQHFWLEGGLRYAVSSRTEKVAKLTLSYTMTGAALEQAQTKFHNAVLELLGIAATGNNEYERERLLHDALATKTTYKDGKNAHNAYGALVEGEAVCEGYARAFQYVLYQAGIPCLIAEGESVNPATGQAEGHAWNVVRIGGQYYHVDLTWDDTDNAKTPVMYPYFNVTTAQITEDHTIQTGSGYSLPQCVATAANYHVKNGSYLTIYTADAVAALFKGKTGGVHLYCVDGSDTFVTWFNQHHRSVVTALGITGSYSYSLLSVGKETVVTLTVR